MIISVQGYKIKLSEWQLDVETFIVDYNIEKLFR